MFWWINSCSSHWRLLENGRPQKRQRNDMLSGFLINGVFFRIDLRFICFDSDIRGFCCHLLSFFVIQTLMSVYCPIIVIKTLMSSYCHWDIDFTKMTFHVYIRDCKAKVCSFAFFSLTDQHLDLSWNLGLKTSNKLRF